MTDPSSPPSPLEQAVEALALAEEECAGRKREQGRLHERIEVLQVELEARTQENNQLHNDIDAFHLNDHDHQGAAVTWHACYREALAAKDAAKVRGQALEAELKVTDALLNERQRVLDAIPPCAQHGPCVQHALEWIKAQADLQAALQGLAQYAEHKDGCQMVFTDNPRVDGQPDTCSCGLTEALEALVRPQQTTEKKKDDAAYQPNSPVGPQCPACGCRHWRGHNTLCSR